MPYCLSPLVLGVILISDMKKIIELDPSNEQAKRSLFRLEPLAAEKREKMKEEMIGNSFFSNFRVLCAFTPMILV